MAYYHGTNAKIGVIDLSKSRLRTDFGKGFYLTDRLETAKNWAVRRFGISGGLPIALRYEINNDLFRLHGKKFDDIPSLEWLHFICHNRKRSPKNMNSKEPRHDFNWVSGPIANDKIADVVDEFLSGDITDEEAIRRARALPFTFQLSLHTPAALNFVDEANVSYKQFKNDRWTVDWLKR
jgi:hypothetical protein